MNSLTEKILDDKFLINPAVSKENFACRKIKTFCGLFSLP